MKRSLFNTRGKLLAVLLFVVTALFVTTVQNAYATTYTTMDAQGNIIQSQSLSDAVALSYATGRPIALDPGHSDGTDGRDPGAMYYGLKEGDIAWATAMYVKKYLEQWGVPVVVVRGEHEDPSIKTRVQRAVDANACAVISLHYNAGPASATGSEVLVPHDVSYNHDLYVAGQALAGKVNYYLRNKAGIVTRGDGATERGYNDKDGTDYYENGDESDYYGIVRYARQKGILGVIIEHQFISNPAHAAEFKDLGDNSKVDYIGWADAWAIWEMYHSDTWWSMSSISAVQKGNKVTVKPVLTGVVTGATFTFGYIAPDGSWTTVAYKTTDTSISFVPPMTGNYVLYLKAISSDGQEITRQMNFEATEGAVTGWKQVANGWMYTDDNGFGYANRWLNDADGWHYFGAQGIATSGWITTADGKTFYADPLSTHNAVKLGQFTVQNRDYYADSNSGVIKDGWVNYGDGNWAWANQDGSLYAGWKLLPNGKWFYFDSEDPHHRLSVGVIKISSGTYNIDVDAGMTSNGWVQLPTREWAWAQSSGAFASGWFNTPNGKTWYFDSTKLGNPAYIGEHSINGKDYYFDEGYGLIRNSWVTLTNGVKRWAGPDGMLTGRLSPNGIFTADNGTQPTGTVKLPGLTLHIGSDHKVKTGWVKENGKDYYYLNDGSAASDWVNIQGTYYYFNTNGEKQTGWVHLKSGWYYLGADGKMRTGWIKDNGKDYYLDSNGTMVTGYTTWGGKLYWAGADGAMEEQPCYYPDMYRYAQNYYSATNWLIQIDTTGNRFAVYRGSHGNWVVWYEWQCTTGAPGMWTPHGQFTVGNKGLYFGSGYRCWYYTTISGEYLIHSILYHADGYTVRDGRLGYNGSHGCVRLATENAKWVYDNIPYGTKIVIW